MVIVLASDSLLAYLLRIFCYKANENIVNLTTKRKLDQSASLTHRATQHVEVWEVFASLLLASMTCVMGKVTPQMYLRYIFSHSIDHFSHLPPPRRQCLHPCPLVGLLVGWFVSMITQNLRSVFP